MPRTTHTGLAATLAIVTGLAAAQPGRDADQPNDSAGGLDLGLSNTQPEEAPLFDPLDRDPNDPLNDPRRPNPYRPRPDVRFQTITVLPADVQDSDGDVTVQRFRIETGLNIPISQTTRLRLSYDHESSFYNFSDVQGTTRSSEGAIDYGASNFFGALFTTQFNEEAGLVAGANFGFAGEVGAEFNDSLLARAFVAPTFQINPKTNLGLGVLALTRLEEDPIIVPFIQIRTQVTERLQIGSSGRGFGATYDLNEQVDLRGTIGLDFRQYRLDDSSGPTRDGIFQEFAVNLGLGTDIAAADNVDITLDLNLLPYRELEFQQSDSTRVSKFTTDPAVSFAFGVRVRF